MLPGVYPDETILTEVGRVAIASGRLDAELSQVWWHLAPDQITDLRARKASARKVREEIRRLAAVRLDASHRTPLIELVTEANAAQDQRHDVLHSRWLLRGIDALRPVSEFLALDETQRATYLEQWEREAKASDGWLRQPSRSMELVPPHALDDLVAIERRLAAVTDAAVLWHFRIASMRETGKPDGWLGYL